jgi:hypothetical protein
MQAAQALFALIAGSLAFAALVRFLQLSSIDIQSLRGVQ